MTTLTASELIRVAVRTRGDTRMAYIHGVADALGADFDLCSVYAECVAAGRAATTDGIPLADLAARIDGA